MIYIISVQVNATDLGAAITAIQPFVKGAIQMEPLGEKIVRTREIMKTKDTRLGKIILDALKTGSATANELGLLIAEQGFAKGSISPTLSRLRQDELVVKGLDGKWRLV